MEESLMLFQMSPSSKSSRIWSTMPKLVAYIRWGPFVNLSDRGRWWRRMLMQGCAFYQISKCAWLVFLMGCWMDEKFCFSAAHCEGTSFNKASNGTCQRSKTRLRWVRLYHTREMFNLFFLTIDFEHQKRERRLWSDSSQLYYQGALPYHRCKHIWRSS